MIGMGDRFDPGSRLAPGDCLGDEERLGGQDGLVPEVGLKDRTAHDAGESGSPGSGWREALEGLLSRAAGPSTEEIASFVARLALCPGPGDLGGGQGHLGGPGHLAGSGHLAGPELIDRLDALERLKAAAAAEQARTQAAFAALCEAGMDPRAAALESRTGRAAARSRERSASAQIALARKVSPARGARLLAASKRLVTDLPCTLRALACGQLTEERAIFMAEGVEVLSPAARAVVDEDLCGHPQRLEGLGDRGVQDAVRAAVDAIDDSAALARVRKAEEGRRVTVRRLPDAMAQLTAILPVAQAASVAGALGAAGAAARAAGDARTRGQVAADTLVERVTGQAHADAVPLRVGLIMTDSSLFAGGREPALLQGYGTVPAAHARAMIVGAATGSAASGLDNRPTRRTKGRPAGSSPGTARGGPGDLMAAGPPGSAAVPSPGAAALAGAWLRRLYLDPSTGELAAMDSRLRRFPRALAEFIEIRDQTCRTPYCEAPIRHIDHVTPVASGGETSVENGQGLCEACNHAKESPGWELAVVGTDTPDGTDSPDGTDTAGGIGPAGTRGDILTLTPTGHEYFSPPRKLPGSETRACNGTPHRRDGMPEERSAG
ncbi:HNH endonuclease [Sinomonas terrae]|uniref:HNH endonuclease n=1 Tax=Sinomonas terrae TaxID=2908838 RepID=A0ABS9U566_9MICC|nr:HNH endonuclease signature motif containing protein [Sinomonas terrae]MCH6471662.1 HNH endonuclease [Sinomonas terrae]